MQLFSELSVSTRRISQFLRIKELREFEDKFGVLINNEENSCNDDNIVSRNELDPPSPTPTPPPMFTTNVQQTVALKYKTMSNEGGNGYNDDCTSFKVTNREGIHIENGQFSWNSIDRVVLIRKIKCNENRESRSKSGRNGRMKLKQHRVRSNSSFESAPGFSLEDIHLDIGPHQFVAVVGTVGSGKSSLLSAMLHELPCYGECRPPFMSIRGKHEGDLVIGFASQNPWITNDSIRNNILFGARYDDEWYDTVITACALKLDIKALPYGDETIIGERGVNLSGGQKARINIARAIYVKPSVLLLDDCLSSVDALVARQIFNAVLDNECGLMRDTLRVLVTHQTQFLSQVDTVMVMKDGILSHCDPLEFMHHSDVEVDATNTMHRHVHPQRNEQESSSEEYDIQMAHSEHFETINTETLNTTVSPMSGPPIVRVPDAADNFELDVIDLDNDHTVDSKYHTITAALNETAWSPIGSPSPHITAMIQMAQQNGIDESEDSSISELDLNDVDSEDGILRRDDPDGQQSSSSETSIMPTLNLSHRSKLSNASNDSLKVIARRNSIVQEEECETGSIPWKTYCDIISAPNRCIKVLKIIFILFLMIGAQLTLVASEYWLGIWASATPQEQHSNSAYRIVYFILALCTVALALWRTAFVFSELLKSCERLSNAMFDGVLFSPMAFFESNPSGRILNRFSKDQSVMDEKLPQATFDWIESVTTCSIVFVLGALSNLYLSIVFVPIMLLIVHYGKSFLASSRVLKRLDAMTRSPILASFSTMYNGLHVIRAFKREQMMLQQSLEQIDVNTRVYRMYHSCVHWLGFRLDICVFVLTSATAFTCVYVQHYGYADVSPAVVGVTLSYMLLLGKILPWTVRQFATVEHIMTSVERVIEYGELPSEEGQDADVKDSSKISDEELEKLKNTENAANIPKHGTLKIENLCVSYRDYLDDVLHDVNLEIADGEKVSVVGRTGCGKSTLFLTLFRILNVSSGSITIGGLDIEEISLQALRSSISIIPQNAILFSGSLRYNIDPFHQHSDKEIYSVLKEVQLFDKVAHHLPDRIWTEIAECGANFSVGECQLICIARALLNRQCQIVLVDEATANVDGQTDAVIQQILKKKFKHKTVLTISHRITSGVMDSDRILVMDKGRVVEFDVPQKLIRKPRGLFAKMYAEANSH